MALDGMLDEIDETKIKGLLLRREDPMVFEETDVFEARVRGAAVEVVLLTGDDPDDLAIRALAVEAIAVQTASAIEYAEFPEQQAQGDTGRGYHLHQRYLELLQRLQSLVDAGHGPDDGEALPTTPAPVGSFPPAYRPIFDPAVPEPYQEPWCGY